MKKVSTTVSTGSEILYNGRTCHIGLIKKGKIEFKISISATSQCTEYISTRELNKRLKTATIIKK